jgi:hypothetical protein
MAWLAAFAILLQSVLPALHHPAGMALAGEAGFGESRNLCLAPGSIPAPADNPGKAPAHHMPACALCQAAHAIGGFAPPSTPMLAAVDDFPAVFPNQPAEAGLPRPGYARQRARAPPLIA